MTLEQTYLIIPTLNLKLNKVPFWGLMWIDRTSSWVGAWHELLLIGLWVITQIDCGGFWVNLFALQRSNKRLMVYRYAEF